MSNQSNDRRNFLKLSGFTLAAAFVGAKLLKPSTAEAAAAVPVNEADPMAQSLGYKEDAKKVDVKKFPKHAGAAGAKQMCSGCQFYQAAQAAGGRAPCTIFGGKTVNAKGWCNTWAEAAKKA